MDLKWLHPALTGVLCALLKGSFIRGGSPAGTWMKKIVVVMKLTAVIVLAACLTASAHGFSQRVTLQAKSAPLETVIQEIKKQTGYSFFYNADWLQKASAVTINVKDAEVSNVLDLIFKNQPLTYKLISNTIVLELKPAAALIREQELLPPVDIRGRIVNENGEPVVASILVKGTQKGTTSNAEGYFELKGVEGNATLIISGVSIETITFGINGRTEFTVTAKTKITAEEEVTINAGYYQVRDRERTGSISKVDTKTIEKQPVLNPLQAIQGRMPGVYVQQVTGVPGGGFNILIRGRNSLREEGNAPLYVIDGVPFTSTSLTSTPLSSSIIHTGNPLASVNPLDILSIEVLKDADATAIYGSRGANGVVLITTKKGKNSDGDFSVDVNIYHGKGRVGKTLDLLHTPDYIRMRVEALQNNGYWPLPPSLYSAVPDVFYWDTTRYTNWQKELIGGTANTTNAQLSFAGGNATTRFLLGGGYYKETTVFPGDYNFQRASGNLTVSHISMDKKFQASVTVNFTSSINRLLPVDLTSTAVTLAPDAPALYTASGDVNWDWQTFAVSHPVSSFRRTYKGITYNLITNGLLSYTVLTGLTAKVNLGYTSMLVNELSTSPLSAIPTQFLSTQRGSTTFGDNQLHTWIVEPQLEYVKNLGKGKLTVLAGATFQKSKQEGGLFTATGYTNDALLENIKAATSISITDASYYEYRYAAVFGRINYNWLGKYILNLTARRDGSSRFGPGKQFGNFAAAGAAWIFSNEQFFQNTFPFVSFGKLRASYGSTGSDAIGNYQYLNTFSATAFPYNNTTGLAVTRLSNPNFSWESNRKLEAALELGFFRDRVQFSAEWYRNRSSNQLVGLPLPVITGQSSVQFNLPATVENTGWEFQLASVNINNKAFRWITDFNISIPRNKLIAFPNLDEYPAYKNQFKVGESLFIKRTLKSTGVDATTGMYSFEDVNGDGNISFDNDGLFLKEVAQQFYGGINNSFSSHGIQLDVFFQFVKQTGSNYIASFSAPGSFSNQPAIVTNRWQKQGDITDIQMYTLVGAAGTAYINMKSSDKAISDASFIRLKNVSLSWQWPARLLKNTGIKSGKVYVQAQNLLTITNYLGLDPENQNTSFLPPLRVIAAGIQFTL